MLTLGKLPVDFLKTCIALTGTPDPQVLIGPRFGEDCAVIDLGAQYLITKTDPVTFATEEIGWYAVHVNANDVAMMGARPRWFQACLLFPSGTKEDTVRQVFAQIDAASKELGIAVTGGHTEVTNAVSQPVVIGDMHGIVDKDRLVTSGGARPGDLVVMSKTAGIEGTSILAAEKAAELRPHLDESLRQEAVNLRHAPGISVVKEALLAAGHGATAMHDPTEGGVAMGLYELATASGIGITLDLDAIPILPVTQTICRFFNLNPLGLISSGTLLLTIPADRWPALRRTFHAQSLTAQVIGTITQGSGISAFSDGKPAPFTYSETDELAKVL
ncbi:MAG TPA: AIR synthase family protein [Candidatus Binatia bacterium]|jgi:hydrogenase maturation factor|nr:AIR synthase family protein [Candidatus Binatia bacterium]